MRLSIGTIVGTHGVEGELRLRLATDDPTHLHQIKQVYVGEESKPRRLAGVRFQTGMALIKLPGVRTVEDGKSFIGQQVRIGGSDIRPLAPEEFYHYQVIGITAFDVAGAPIGIVADILETGANDVFVIKPDGEGAEILLPNIPQVVLEINPTERRMVVRPLKYWDSE